MKESYLLDNEGMRTRTDIPNWVAKEFQNFSNVVLEPTFPCYFGLSSVFMYTYVQAFMYCTGFFLLFHLGFQSVKQGISHSNMEYKKEEVGGLKQSFMAGFLIAISNPLNLVFWFGIYGSTLSSLLTKVTKQEAFLYSLVLLLVLFCGI